MRSLTCKTHTVGAKRAVEGRTRSYDILFIEWQRINNPNFKEPAPRKDKAAREEEKRQKNRGEDLRKKIKKPKPVGPVETLGADEDESEEMEALIRATRYAGKKVHSTVRARLGGNTVTAFPAVIPRREVSSYPQPSAPADANPAGCLAIWQCGRHDQLRVGQLLASALATRKVNVGGDDSKRGSASAAMFGNKGSGLGVQLSAVQVQG
jgi:SAGA-associated factor 73